MKTVPTPVVNIGNRQKGRLNAGNVEFVKYDKNEIISAVTKACLDKDYRNGIKKLTNPQKRIKEIYHLILDKNLKSIDFKKLQDGITIGGKRAAIDRASYINGKEKNEIGFEISMGGIKMVNLIFEKIGYKVQRIDRVFFAGLSKKDLPRKRYRFLSAEEVGLLKRL